MKTNRLIRIFMMLLDYIAMFFLRLFRPFARCTVYPKSTLAQTTPYATEKTAPAYFGIETKLEVDDVAVETYTRKTPIAVTPEQPYTKHKGIITFRGDHLRSGAAYGGAAVKEKKLRIKWNVETGKLEKGYGKGYWTGSGWTGQPLIVRWEAAEKESMPLFPAKKGKADLAEVIYATMDGNVYFLDLEDGSSTREVLQVGLPFKGAGALHPSLPILHLGPGDSGPAEEEYARAYLYSLTDGEKLLEYGGQDPFAPRKFHGFDSSPLFFDDYMLEPAENGIIYSYKLNSKTDETGKISITPTERVKFTYTTGRSSEESYWLGMEDSAVVWQNYMYIADNGGTLFCLDLNTMKMVWAQDVVDDTNGSPVLSMEEGIPYLYIGTSLHWSASKRLKLGEVPFFKINGITGEYVWTHHYFCCTVAGISGGIQATPVLGKHDLEGLVIVPIARTPSVRNGIIVALDKKTGEEVWRYKLPAYAWSSPVAVYDGAGQGYILQGDSGGMLHLLEGKTGKLLDSISLGSNIEASPAVFENTLVVGTRGMKIFGVEII